MLFLLHNSKASIYINVGYDKLNVRLNIKRIILFIAADLNVENKYLSLEHLIHKRFKQCLKRCLKHTCFFFFFNYLRFFFSLIFPHIYSELPLNIYQYFANIKEFIFKVCGKLQTALQSDSNTAK